MGAFVGANYDSFSSLNKEIEIKEHELQQVKQEQSQKITQHETRMQ